MSIRQESWCNGGRFIQQLILAFIVSAALLPRPGLAVERVFNVPAATGDGALDTAAVQSTLTAAAAAFNTSDGAGFSGVAVVFPTGTYTVTNRLTMMTTNRPVNDGGIMIRGQGPSASVIQSSNTTGTLYFDINTSNQIFLVRIQMEDLGFKAIVPAAGPAIEIRPSADAGQRIVPFLRNVYIGRVGVANYYTYGFKAWRVREPIIDNTTISLSLNCSTACILLEETYAFNIKDSKLEGAAHGVHHIIGGEGGTLNRVTITNVQTGVEIDNDINTLLMSASDCKVLNSSISASQCGVLFDWKHDVFVSNNQFFSQAGDNAYTDIKFNHSKDSFITGNTFAGTGAGRTGIALDTLTNYLDRGLGKTIISDNTFGAFNTGVYVGSNILQTAIFSNTFSTTTALVDNGIGTTLDTSGTPAPFVSPADANDSENFSWGATVGYQVYNVTSAPYNAVGNGTNDDTAAIQAAAAAAVAYLTDPAKKAVLYFPAGTYKVTDQISLLPTSGSNLVICGDGMSVSVIERMTGGTAGLFNIQVPATTRVDIHNIKLDAAYVDAGNAIYMKQLGTPTGRSLYLHTVIIEDVSTSYFNRGLRGENLSNPLLENVWINMASRGDAVARPNTKGIELTGGSGFECENTTVKKQLETAIDITSSGGALLFKNAHALVVGPDVGIRVNAGGGTVAIEGAHVNCPQNFDITNAINVSLLNTVVMTHDGTAGPSLRLTQCTDVKVRNNAFCCPNVRSANPMRRSIWLYGTANANVDIYGNSFAEPGDACVYTQAGAPGPKVRNNRFDRTDIDDIAGPVSTVIRSYELNGAFGTNYLIKSKVGGNYLAADGTGAAAVTCSKTEITDTALWNVVYTEEGGFKRYLLKNKKQGRMLQYVAGDVDCSGTVTNGYTQWLLVNREDGLYSIVSGADLTKYLGYQATDQVDCSRTALDDNTKWEFILADDLAEGIDPGTLPAVTQTSGADWTTVNFLQPFHHPPAVFVGGPECNDTAPLTVRVKNVTTTNFQFQLDEWDNADGIHAAEEVSFFAMHKGRYKLASRTCEAGTITGVNTNWTTKAFSTNFPKVPCVLAQCTSVGEPSAVCTRVRNVTVTNFQVRLQEGPGGDGPHTAETVDFIAIDPGTDPYRRFEVGRSNQCASANWTTLQSGGGWSLPGFAGSVQSYYGTNACVLRYQTDSLTSTNVIIKVDDASDLSHTAEDVGWIVFDSFAGGLASVDMLSLPNAWQMDAAGFWTNSANWTDGIIPGISGGSNSSDVAIFASTLTTNRIVTVDASRNIGGITFANAANLSGTNAATTIGYTLSGGSIKLSNGGVIQINDLSGTNISTINSAIVIQENGGSATFRNDAAGSKAGLVIASVTGTSTAGNVTTLYLDGASTSSGIGGSTRNNSAGLIGNGAAGGKLAVVKNGTGLWSLFYNSTFTGGLFFNAGTLRYYGSGTQFGGAGSIITIGTNVIFSHANNLLITNTQPLVVNGDFSLVGSANTLWTGAMDLGAAVRVVTAASTNNTFSGVVSNGGITKAGAGELILSGSNTYGGGTTVSEGKLVGSANGALGSGPVTVAGGATLTLNSTNCLGDQAGLILATNATLNLTFTGTDTVGGISPDGGATWLPGGVYTAAQLDALGAGTCTGFGSLLVEGFANDPAGTPYSWLAQYGLTNFNSDALTDADSDGLRTWQEYVAGTNPTNSASSFRITRSVTPQGSVISWSSVSNRFYDLSRTTNLLQSFSGIAGASNLPATPPENVYTNPVPDGAAAFYRISVHE